MKTDGRRVLFVTVESPYPPSSGAPLRNWQNLSLAARSDTVALLSIGRAEAAVAVPNVAIHRHVVLPPETATAVPGFPSFAGATARTLCDAIDDMLDAFKPQVTVFENVWIAGAVERLHGNGCKVVFDTHNAYGALADELGLDGARVRELERDAVRTSDGVWACSSEDAERLQRTYGRAEPTVVPNGIDTAYYEAVRARPPRWSKARLNLLFVGSFWYAPNRAAAEELITDVLPLVRSESKADVRLILVGAAPSATMVGRGDDSVRVTGRVADVRPYLVASDVVTAPLRAGGGTRLKVLEAFAAGRPVVATAKAVEGLDVSDGEELLVRETPEQLAQAVVAMWKDAALRDGLTARAYRRVETTYSWDVVAEIVDRALHATV